MVRDKQIERTQFDESTRKYPFKLLSGEELDESRDRMLANIRAGMKKEEGGKVRTLWSKSYGIAAAVAILIAASCLLYMRLAEDTISVTASESIHKEILADGTIIWLKPHSTLIYPETFTGKDRAVTLQGEALFEVAKDPEHPFVIQCEELTTTVLGTSFNIRSGEDEIEVTVLTGKVSLTSTGNPEGIVVFPNETATFRKALYQLSKVETEKGVKALLIAGTEYDMNFKGMPAKDVADRIEEKFGVNVRMEEIQEQKPITADLTDVSFRDALEVIAGMLNATYERDGDQVILKK